MISLIIVAVTGMVVMVFSVLADNVPLAIMGSSLFLAPTLMAVMFMVDESRRKKT